MSPGPAIEVEPPSQEPRAFSLVQGGLTYWRWRRLHLVDGALELVRRRIVVLVLLTWAPLLLLSLAQGQALGSSAALPFLHDADVQVRLFLALPLLLVAELVAHRRMRFVVAQFLERDLIPDAAQNGFDAAIASAMRLRDSAVAECLIVVFVYGIGVLLAWRAHVALGLSSWYGTVANGRLQPSPAGWWLMLVTLPLFQFLLVRWYYRLFIWARFLWQVSRIELRLLPTHPDRCGGLSFLGVVRLAFAPLLLAHGALLAGLIANRIFFGGASLPEFKIELVAMAALMVLVVLGPLLFFSPQLDRAERSGMRRYGMLAQRYAREFDQKWLHQGAPAGEPLLGSADIQSLADMGNSFEVVRSMRWAPFGLQTVLHVAIMTLLPVLPLTLTMFSPQELLERLLKVVF